jgi:hypothetical protein
MAAQTDEAGKYGNVNREARDDEWQLMVLGCLPFCACGGPGIF